MRLRYENVTLEELILFIDLFPTYDFICDADDKEIIMKEKEVKKDDKER